MIQPILTDEGWTVSGLKLYFETPEEAIQAMTSTISANYKYTGR